MVHEAIVTTIILFAYLARPLSFSLGLIDWFLILAPVPFLTLGFADEIVYHRRRALHRENILHTVSHIVAAAMLASIVAARMIDWSAVLPK